MMSEKVAPIFQPDKEVMKRHLELLFKGTDDSYIDGKIEISRLTQSEYFNLSDIDGAVNQAALWNAQGHNVYTTAAILVPDVKDRIQARFVLEKKKSLGRAKGEDFYAANASWVDIDKDVDKERLKELYKNAKPNFYVLTSKVPAMRVHFWWQFDRTLGADRVKEFEALNKGIIAALGGDQGTYNCTRLMRIGGSVAWPTKDGRITEQVEAKNTDWFPPHDFDKLVSVYPMASEASAPQKLNLSQPKLASTEKSEWSLESIQAMLDCIPTDNEYLDWLKVGMALKDYGVPFEVWDSWSAKGAKYDPVVSRDKWGGFNGTGTTIGTIYYFAKNNGFNPKKNTPVLSGPSTVSVEVIDEETGEITTVQKPYISATCIDDIDLDNIPPREFLYGTIIGRKYVTMIVAPPGAGKSMFTMQIAISAATGKEWGKWHPAKKNLNVWVYNNEEGQDELFRRIRAVMIENGIGKSDFGGRFYIDSGETKPISVANVKDNVVVHTPDYEGLLAEVKNRKIDILIVDPFAETHSVTENSNEQIKDVVRLYRDIAFKANCAVLLVHHTRKGASEMAGEADSARGGGAQIGVVRRMFTLSTMTKNEAEKIGVPPEKRKWFIRFDDAKTNITAPADVATWLKFKSVSIKNGVGLYPDGDSVGVLTHLETDKISAEFADEIEDRSVEILTLIVEMMDSSEVELTTLPDVIDYIKSFSKLQFSDRSLRDMVKNAVEKAPKKTPFVAEGIAHSFSIIKKAGAKNNAVSIRKYSENI